MNTTPWLDELTATFLGTVDTLTDDEFTAPTALAGWTRAHVVAHVHFNALALRRLVSWARSGEETPMYASPSQRAEEIDRGADETPASLRMLVHDSARALGDDFADLSTEQLERTIVTAQGRHLPARDISWLRCRELAVHAVDLDAGVTFCTLPDGFVTALVHDAVTKRVAGGEAAALAAVLTGRSDAGPSLGPWL
ncbi:MAG: maleylpyruvate isomerase N-terminal domain-containing protein [Ilumatobacteraceae bacterium]